MPRSAAATLFLASAMTGVLATPSARATPSVVQPPLDLGQTSFLDGEAGPGALFEVIGNGYVAPQFNNASGGRVPGTNRQWIASTIFHFAYVSDIPVAGGFLGAEALLPVATLHLQVPGVGQATKGGLGDVTLAPFIQWTKLPIWQRPLSVRVAIQAVAPTGQYSPNDPINPGLGAWQVSPYLAFTWRVSDRWEISGRSIYDWSGRNDRPPTSFDATSIQAGGQFAQDLSVSVAVSDAWRIGVASYGLWQTGDARVDGQAVAGRQQVIGLGPGLLWSDGHATVIANVYQEVAVHDRPQGTSVVLRLLHPF
jgi:hypothetical protein